MGKQHLLRLALMLGFASPASAALVINVTEVGGETQIVGTGSIDLTGLAVGGTKLANSYFFNGFGEMMFNSNFPAPEVGLQIYLGGTPGGAFGGTSPGEMETLGGDFFFLGGDGSFAVATDYVSGAPLNLAATVPGDYAALLMTVGDYVWTLPNDTITVSINPVPEPATFVLLLGASLSGLRRRRTS